MLYKYPPKIHFNSWDFSWEIFVNEAFLKIPQQVRLRAGNFMKFQNVEF